MPQAKDGGFIMTHIPIDEAEAVNLIPVVLITGNLPIIKIDISSLQNL